MKKIVLLMAALAVTTLSFSQYFVEDFENGGVFPTGWGLSNGLEDWAIDMGDNYGPGSAQSGTYSAFYADYDYASPSTADMISPKIDLSTATSPELVFWYYDGSGSDVVEVLTSLDSSAFATVYTTNTSVTSWTKITVDISALAGQANVWIAFRGTSVYGFSNPHVDNIVVQEAPTCPDPSALSATVISHDSASIDWTENAGATSWYVEYGTSPLTLGTGTKVLTNNPDTLTGLTANTTYEFYIKSICGAGDSSNWVGPWGFTTPPTCPDPSSLSATVISSDSVSIDWTENAGATSWYISYGVSPITANAGTKVLTNNPDTLTGLTAATTYQYYVKSICGAGDSSEWVGPYDFTTACPALYTPYYSESFDNYPGFAAAPQCWTDATGILEAVSVLSMGGSNWDQVVYANTGSNNAAYLNLYGTGREDWLISPSIDLGTGNSYQAEFDIAMTEYDETFGGTLGDDDTVAFVISTDNGATWSDANILALWDTANNTLTPAGSHVIIDLSSYTGVVKFAFYGVSTSSNEDNDIFIDNFEVKTIPSCPQPTSLNASSVTSTTADLTWTEFGTATQWEIEYDLAGFTSGTGNNSSIVNTTSIYNASALAPAADYEFYVRAICSAGDSSGWTGPFAFSTTCPSSFTPAYSQDFSAFLPQCWTDARGLLETVSTLSMGGSTWDQVIYANAGTDNAAYLNLYGTGKEDWLISPSIDLGTGGSYQAEFDIAMTDFNDTFAGTLGDDDTVAFLISTDNGVTWSDANILALWDTANNTLVPAGTHITINLSSYTGVVKFAFYGESTTSNEDNDIFIDNFEVVSSSSASVTEIDNNLKLDVFPNPNNGEFNIRIHDFSEALNIQVISTLGQIVYTDKITSNTSSIKLNGVSKGSYIVRLYNDKTSTQKMLIVK